MRSGDVEAFAAAQRRSRLDSLLYRYNFCFVPIYTYCFHTHSVYLSFRHGVFILYTPCHLCPLAVNRSCFGICLALADGSGLPFSLLPPLAALESQTPQREPRRLPPHATDLPPCIIPHSAFRIPHYLINGSPRFFSVAGEICEIYTFSLFPSEVMQKLFGSS